MPKHSFTLGENRTIFVTLDELNAQRAKVGASPVVAPYNTRTAEANASQQVAQRQAQLELNQSTGQTVGAGMQIAPTTPINTQLANAQTTYKNSALGLQSGITNTLQDGQQVSSPVSLVGKDSFQQGAIDRMRERGMSDEQIRTQLDEVAPQLQSTMSNTGLGGTFDQKGMFVPKTIAEAQNVLATSRNPQEKAQAQKVIDDQLNEVKGYAPRTNVDPATGATWVTYSEDAGATAKAREEAKNRMAIEEQNRLNLQKLKEDAKKKVALMVPNDIKETSDKVLQLKAVLDQLSPELRAAGSLEIQQMLDGQDRISKATQQALDTFSTDTEIEDSYQGTEDRIKQVEKLFLQFADDSKATAERVANYNRDMLLIDKKIMESKNAEDETKQIQANIKNERKLRRQLAALNITTDLQGLQYLDDAIQEGQSTLASLRNANSLNLLKAQLAIGEGYAIEMQKAMDNQRASYLDITTKTTDALEAVRKSISLDKKDRNKEIRSILAKDAEDKNKLETETAKALRELAKQTSDNLAKARQVEATERNADKRLEYQEKMALQRLQYQEDRADIREVRLNTNSEKAEAQKVRSSFTTAEDQAEVKNYITIRDAYNKAKENLDSALATGKKIDIGVAKEIATVLHEKALDPSSVVREGEYLRASKGQGWVDNVSLFAKAVANGETTGITVESAQAFIEAMGRSTEVQRASALSRYASSLNYLQSFNASSQYINVDPRTVAIPPELLRAEDLSSFIQEENSSYNYDYGSYSGNKDFSYEEDKNVVSPLTQSIIETGLTIDQIIGDWEGLDLMSTPQSESIQSSTKSVGETLSLLAPMTQGFNTPISTKNYSQKTVNAWGGSHQGLDLAFSGGTFVPSVTEGILEKIEYNKGGWGLTAIIRAPDGAEIRYSHLASVDPSLKIGMRIQKGREIAQVGNTGNVFSTRGGDGTHLDFRIKKDGKYIDPFFYYS